MVWACLFTGIIVTTTIAFIVWSEYKSDQRAEKLMDLRIKAMFSQRQFELESYEY